VTAEGRPKGSRLPATKHVDKVLRKRLLDKDRILICSIVSEYVFIMKLFVSGKFSFPHLKKIMKPFVPPIILIVL